MPKPNDDEVDLSGVEQIEPEEDNPPNDPSEEEPDNPDDFEDEADEGKETEQSDEVSAQSRERVERTAGRATDRIKSLDRRLREAEEREKTANRRIDELLKARQQPVSQQQPTESAEQRAQRRSSLTPEERVHEDLRDSETRLTQQIRGMQLSTWDQNDRALYQTKAVNDPRYKRMEAKVEAEFQRLRQEGGGASREAILKYMIGEDILSRPAGSSKQRTEAAKRVAASSSRPSQSRGDTNVGKRERSGGKTLEERLSDVPL